MENIKLLVIEDDGEVLKIVIEEGTKLGFSVVPFEPKSKERNDLLSQLSDLCQANKFDFALLDYELWQGFKGYLFAETLHNNSIKFASFSSSEEGNRMLLKVGAIFAIQKDYNSRGFNRQLLIQGLNKILKS